MSLNDKELQEAIDLETFLFHHPKKNRDTPDGAAALIKQYPEKVKRLCHLISKASEEQKTKRIGIEKHHENLLNCKNLNH